MTYAYTATERTRVNFGKIPEAMELPTSFLFRRKSFQRFMDEGLREAFKESSPIQSSNHVLEVTFGEHQFGDPAHTVEECREKDMTYQAPLLTDVRLTNKETGEIKEQLVFMGDFPMMTDQGTFIINGTERIVVSQLVRSPGVYYSSEMDGGKQVYKAQIIPARGAWLEFEVDKRDQLVVSIDRKRKQSATMFLRALGIAVTNDDIIELLGDSDVIKRTIERDTALTREDALIEIYRRLRPGEPPTVDASRSLLEGLLFNPQRYDLARVGRYKVNKKLNLDTTEEEVTVLTDEDIVATLRYLLSLAAGEHGFKTDDIDHFGNRRIRTVGELVANQFRIGMSRMERVVRERMSSQDIDEITLAVAHQHPSDRGRYQGVLRLLAAVPVHGSGKPADGSDPQASSVRTRPWWSCRSQVRFQPPYQRAYGRPRRSQLALQPHVPDRDPRRPQHRPDRLARPLCPRQRVRLHRGPVPSCRERRCHRPDRLDDR